MPRLMVIDCDTGVDDAMALMIAVCQVRQVKVVAVTCVGGNTALDNVVRNTCLVLSVCGSDDVPVYRGAPCGLLRPPPDRHTPSVHGAGGLGDCVVPDPPEGRVSTEAAPVALCRLAKEHPGEITLVTLGPLTNVALAQRLDPAFCGRLKEVVIMGGSTAVTGNMPVNAEFNIYCDPEAAWVVLNDFTCPLTVMPFNICVEHHVPYGFLDKLLGLGTDSSNMFSRAVKPFIERQQKVRRTPGFVCCDGLAMVAAVFPRSVEKDEPKYMTVECEGTVSRGLTIVDWRNTLQKKPNVSVISKIDIDVIKMAYEEALS